MIKFIIILLIINSIESRIIETKRNVRQNKTENRQYVNRPVPVISERTVFDTRSLDEEALHLLLTEDDRSDDDLQDLSEESSGDTDPTDRMDKRAHSRKQADLTGPRPVSNEITVTDRFSKVHTPKKQGHVFENGWIQFKYEKSFMLVNRSTTREEAEQICRKFNEGEDVGSELAVPQSEDEMEFLNHYLFNMSHSLKNVWIGQNTDNYRNTTNIDITLYSNWAKGMPTLTQPCIQLRSPYTIYADTDNSVGGKWEDVACYRKNLVLCQKPQHWSEHQFIRVLTELKRDVEYFKRKTGMHSNMDTIPLGFIYVQLPHQMTPKQLWSKYDWKDVSTLYNGLFFRVIGGKASPFGSIQEATSPRLNGFKSYGIHGVPSEEIKTHEIKADNKWSGDGSDDKSEGYPVSFRVSKDEVTPRNTAVKVWKRV